MHASKAAERRHAFFFSSNFAGLKKHQRVAGEVLEYWKKMSALVDEKNGLRIDELQRVDPKEYRHAN